MSALVPCPRCHVVNPKRYSLEALARRFSCPECGARPGTPCTFADPVGGELRAAGAYHVVRRCDLCHGEALVSEEVAAGELLVEDDRDEHPEQATADEIARALAANANIAGVRATATGDGVIRVEVAAMKPLATVTLDAEIGSEVEP